MHSLISGRLQKEPCLNAQSTTWGFNWSFTPAGKKETDFFCATGLKRSTEGTLVTPREQTGHCKQVLANQSTDVVLCSSTAVSALPILHRTWGARCRQQSKLLEPWKMGKREDKTRKLEWSWYNDQQCCSNAQQRNGGTPHLTRSFCFQPSADPAKHHPTAPFQSWVEGTHRTTKCSCIQAQILEQACSTGSIHCPPSSESFWSPPLTKISNYLHILLPFSTFQLHGNANNSSANRDLWQLETLLMLSHGWFNTSESILIPTAATPHN